MLLAEMDCSIVRMELRWIAPSSQLSLKLLRQSLRVGCYSQYAEMIFEFRKKNNLRNVFLILVNMGRYGSEYFKMLLLVQF